MLPILYLVAKVTLLTDQWLPCNEFVAESFDKALLVHFGDSVAATAV